MSESSMDNKQFPEVRLDIRKDDIRPEIPEVGGTVLVIKCNAKDDRSNPDASNFGDLKPESAQESEQLTKKFFDSVFSQLNDQDKKNTYVLVVASDTSLVMPDGKTSPHQRAIETAKQDIVGIKSSMSENGVDKNQLLNNLDANGDPISNKDLIDLEMLKNPEFVKYMVDKYGAGQDFWVAYEEEKEFDKRSEMNIEGPTEIAIRMRKAFTDMTQDIATNFHQQNPDSRLIIWTVSHYDSISPFLKGYAYQSDPANLYVPMEKNGGITVKINKDNTKAETMIGNEKFNIPALLKKP